MIDTIGIILEKVNKNQIVELIDSIEANGIVELNDKKRWNILSRDIEKYDSENADI